MSQHLGAAPLVSCVVPCHNHAGWVCGAIDSLARQDYPNKRIVVVDDGSTDGSWELVRGYLEDRASQEFPDGVRQFYGYWKDTGVPAALLSLPKANGPALARNMGIKVAWEGTDLFAFLDSDDWYEPDKVSLSVREWLKAPDQIAVIYSDYDTVNPSGLRSRVYKEPYGRERLYSECLVNCDSLVSKKAFAECGLFDETLRVAEDYDRWLSFSKRFMLVHIPRSLVCLRVGQHSSTSTVTKTVWEDCYRRVMQKAQQNL
jgi:glycosyltransferase involved in cell wall biosynthesis